MNLLHKLAQVSSLTMLSRVLGFVRDNLIARIFGSDATTDAFFVAFKIPNLLRRIFAEGAFSQAFVPILAQYKEKETFEQTKIFAAFIAGLLSLSLLVITILGIAFAPFLVWISAPGFSADADKFALTIILLRITFPYILLISLSSFCGAILNTWNIFSVPAFAPVLLNLSMITCALLLAPFFDVPIIALAIGVIIGGVLQVAYQLPFIYKIGMLVLPRFNLQSAGVWQVLKNMAQAIVGVSVAQISLLINTVFASFLVAGSVSWMYYADRLMELPAGVLGVALGTLLLPSLAKTYASDDLAKYHQLLNWGLRLCLLLAAPCALGLALLAAPITQTLFQYGQFSSFDALMTQRALSAYAVGLIALMLIKVLAPGFYARQNIKTPVKIAIASLVITQLLNIFFLTCTNLGHIGLALAISLAAWFNVSLLAFNLHKQGLLKLQTDTYLFIFKIGASLVVMTLVLLVSKNYLMPFISGSFWQRLGYLMLIVMLGGASYLACLLSLRIRLRDFAYKSL